MNEPLAHDVRSFKSFLFNVQSTVEVTAHTEEEAYDILNGELDESASKHRQVKERDVMLVEVICYHDGEEDASHCKYAPEFPSRHIGRTVYAANDPNHSRNLPK